MKPEQDSADTAASGWKQHGYNYTYLTLQNDSLDIVSLKATGRFDKF